MKTFSAIAAAAAIVAVIVAPAAAAPRLVAPSESAGNPAFAGDEIVYSAGLSTGGTEIRAVAPDGTRRVVHRLVDSPVYPDPWDEGGGDFWSLTVELRGSAQALAARNLSVSGDRYGYGSRSDILGGAGGAGLAQLASQCNSQDASAPGVDVDGSRVAYVRETCDARGINGQVVVRDLGTGAETAGPAAAGRDVRLAGRYVAFRPPRAPATVHIYDLESGQVVKTVTDAEGPFDIQADGTLADGPQSAERCARGVRWRALGEETAHAVADCPWGLVELDDDHIAVSQFQSYGRGALAVVDLHGQARLIDLPGPLAQQPDLDGNRVVFTTRGCSTDTGGVWIDDGSNAPKPPAPPQCSVRLPNTTLRLARDGTVRVPVDCPTGCRGSIEIRGGHRYEDYFHIPFGPGDMFEAAEGQRVRVPVKLEDLPRRYRHRTLRVRVAVHINQRVNPYRVVGAVRYVKLRS